MASGRTIWWPKDTAWWRREWIVELGEEFGAAGPAIIDWLSCEAKLQDNGGAVKSGVKSVARGTFVDVVTVGHVLSRAVALGQLEDFEERDGRFECRISGWKADNERGTATLRKRQQRDRQGAASGLLEPNLPPGQPETGRDLSRDVPSGPLRVEERREGQQTSSIDPGRVARSVDQDALPDTLEASLHPCAGRVLDVLVRVQAERGGAKPTSRGVGLAMVSFPNRDFEAVASELEHWALAGRGQAKPVKDWARTYRTFLERSPEGSPTRRAETPQAERDRRKARSRAALTTLLQPTEAAA
jgi:hypothetical protein